MHHNKPQTLVILTPGFPENEADTTCLSHLQTFVKALKVVRPQLTITILTFEYPFLSTTYNWFGFTVIPFGKEKPGKIHNLFTRVRIWRTLSKLNKTHQIVGLYSFWFGKCAYIGQLFAKYNKLKHYCWVLGQDVKQGNKYFKILKPGSESLIIVSDFIAGNLLKNYGIAARHIIPMGIEPALFSNTGTPRDIDILGVGSLVPLKQYSVFLETIAAVKQTLPNITAVICGEGPEMEQLKETAKSLNINDNITFIGSIPHIEALALMKRAKILLHPSNYEGFSTVCMEALYAGAKVISIVKPMAFDIKNWYIAGNVEEMQNYILDILQDTNVQFESVLPYTVEKSATAIIELFEKQMGAVTAHTNPQVASGNHTIRKIEYVS